MPLCGNSRLSSLSVGIGALAIVAIGAAGAGCHKKNAQEAGPQASASASASAAPKTLTQEQAAQVLAKVGDRTITLGDYAAALERMDTFERLRYQSPERRRLLLTEMIEVELLSQEAKRRGLDKKPETEERVREMLRDELLKDLRRSLPSPNDLPEADVRKYYDEHKADFNEPERRRVAHIAVGSLAEAKAVLAKAQNASAADWGKLVADRSIDKGPKSLGSTPPELAGDLGIVGPPGHPRGTNPRVPEALRAAVFKIDKVGSVLPEVVQDGGQFHIVRLTAKTEPRDRTFEEAERTIRVALLQDMVKQKEADLEKQLREKFPVTVDDAELAKIRPPKPAPSGAPPAANRHTP
jgi:parvulin-like peptidyl-prolyl isomerase